MGEGRVTKQTEEAWGKRLGWYQKDGAPGLRLEQSAGGSLGGCIQGTSKDVVYKGRIHWRSSGKLDLKLVKQNQYGVGHWAESMDRRNFLEKQ